VKMIKIAGEAACRRHDIRLAVKLHPMDDKSWLIRDEIKKLPCQDRVSVIDKYDTLKLVAASDLVISGGSTVYLEALLLNVPVLIFDDYARRFWARLKSEYVDLNDKDGSVDKILGLLEDPQLLEKRLLAQESELAWHFLNGNIDVTGRFYDFLKPIRPA